MPSLITKPPVSGATAMGIVIALLLFIAIGIQHTRPASPAAASLTPLPAFSAERAMLPLRHIADKPHPMGTQAHTQTRQYLMQQLAALGLEPQVQSTFTALQASGGAGMVHNIVARLPGSESSGKALLLSAHYDSVPGSFGAADNGASVAAILETLRALKTGPRLKNDIICFFSDGEEMGLLGAHAFIEQHPLAKNIGLVLNFEYRGNSGPFWMFETSSDNGKLIDGFSSAVTHPLGNSLLYEVYKKMPNDTDMTAFKHVNIPGLNFAAGEHYNSYHTPLDRHELLDQASLQHQGEIMLALAQYFGNQPLDDLGATDSVYFDTPGFGLVHYSTSWVYPLSALVAVLFIAATVIGIRKRFLRIGRIGIGVFVFVLTIAALAFACALLWSAILILHPGYSLLLHGSTYNDAWYLVFFCVVALGLFLLIQCQLKRWIQPAEWTFAAMVVWVLLLVVVSITLPGVSFLFTWPLIPMLLAFIWVFLRGETVSANKQALIFLAGASFGAILFSPMIHLLFNALTPQMIFVPITILVLLLGLFSSLLEVLAQKRIFLFAPIPLALALLVGSAMTSGFDAEHPQPSHLLYVQAPVPDKAFWMSMDAELDEWTRSFLPDATRQTASDLFGPSRRMFWIGSAPLLGLQAPVIQLLSDKVVGNIRNVVVTVRSPRQAPTVHVQVEGADVKQSSVQGHAYTNTSISDWSVSIYGMQDAPVRLDLQMHAGAAFKVRVRDFSYGLPTTATKPRPSHMMGQSLGFGDTQQAITVLDFSETPLAASSMVAPSQ